MSISNDKLIQRRVDSFNGVDIIVDGKKAYTIVNHLGSGSTGMVYQAIDLSVSTIEKSVAIKEFYPILFPLTSMSSIQNFITLRKGEPLSLLQKKGKEPLKNENICWKIHPIKKDIIATAEGKELYLQQCIDIWGYYPFGKYLYSLQEEMNLNKSSQQIKVQSVYFTLPLVAPNYLQWLRDRHKAYQELANMAVVGPHNNIVALYEGLEMIQRSKSQLFMVLEVVSGGDLFQRLEQRRIIPEDFARRYFIQLLAGIEYCHLKGICHRDLKPENLLLTDSSESAILKIADFGMSAAIFAVAQVTGDTIINDEKGNADLDFSFPIPLAQQSAYVAAAAAAAGGVIGGTTNGMTPKMFTDIAGSAFYIAPEVLFPTDSDGYDGRMVDMWSAGVVLFCLLTGELPFDRDLKYCERYALYKSWFHQKYFTNDEKDVDFPDWLFPRRFPELAKSLVLNLLHLDPRQRLSAAKALKHPWCTSSSTGNTASLFHTRLTENSLDNMTPLHVVLDATAGLSKDVDDRPSSPNIPSGAPRVMNSIE